MYSLNEECHGETDTHRYLDPTDLRRLIMQEIELDRTLRIFNLVQKLHSKRCQILMDILNLIHPWGRFDHSLVNEAPDSLRFHRLQVSSIVTPSTESDLLFLPAFPARYR